MTVFMSGSNDVFMGKGALAEVKWNSGFPGRRSARKMVLMKPCSTGRPSLKLSIHPLTPERWPALRALFGDRGGCGGCWCMYWRLGHSQWVKQKGTANERAFRELVEQGPPPGLLAYADGDPVGWCALAPRGEYPRLAKSRILKPVDEQPVWSITCFFVARPLRRRGVSLALLRAAGRFAAGRGARILEGYPCEVKAGFPDVFYYTGLVSAFRRAGFREVARRSAQRPVMRRIINTK